MATLNTEPPIDTAPRGGRLESWKEIASYLNRSERTVRRWEEKEGLPIRRLQHDKRGSVFAYSSELDAWRESRQQLVAAEPPDVLTSPLAPSSPAVEPRRRRWVILAVAVTLVAIVAAGLSLMLRRPSGRQTSSPEALRAFQRAAFAFNAGRVQVQSGIDNFQEAIRLDPAFADAWSGLASAHVAQTWFSDLPASETMALARRAADRARQLQPTSSDPPRVLGAVSHYHDWDHAAAERQFREAIALDPRSSVALSWFAEFLLSLGRFDEAAEYARRSQEAAPRWLEPMVVSGNVHLLTGHHDLAIAEYRRALAIEPVFGLANHFLGRAYLAAGDTARAVEQLRKSNDLMGEVPFTLGDLGYALAVSGARPEAEAILARLKQKREQRACPAFAIAVVHVGLGHKDAALDWLQQAVDERHPGYYFPSVDPVFRSVSTDPRFKALMQRMNVGAR